MSCSVIDILSVTLLGHHSPGKNVDLRRPYAWAHSSLRGLESLVHRVERSLLLLRRNSKHECAFDFHAVTPDDRKYVQADDISAPQTAAGCVMMWRHRVISEVGI